MFSCGMGESAVSQAIRSLVMRMEEDRRLKKEVLEVEKEMKKLSTVCRSDPTILYSEFATPCVPGFAELQNTEVS